MLILVSSFYFATDITSNRSLSLTMKVINIDNSSISSSNYDDLDFCNVQKQSKFGTLSYFRNRIYLVKTTPVVDYGSWTSEEGKSYLCLDADKNLENELSKIKDAVGKTESFVGVQWKVQDDKTKSKFFVPLEKNSSAVEFNCELRYTIAVYGVFTQKSTNLSFLQTVVQEHETSKLSFLKKSITEADLHKMVVGEMNYEPSSSAWNTTNEW